MKGMGLKWQTLSLAALVVALYIGLKLPDVDQRVGFLLHRSIVTHGPLLPLLAFVLAQGDNPVPRKAAMGIGIGFAVHMAFDLFPRAWQGYALISLPVYGRTPAVFSWIWTSAMMLVSMSIAVKLIRNGWDAIVLLTALAATFAFAASGERALWFPLGVTAGSLLVSYWLTGPDKDAPSLLGRGAAFR
jgi:hypothetical protein